jgi:hypothetical protein
MLCRHTRNGQIYQHLSTPLQLERVFLQGMMSRINHYQTKLVSRQTETSTFQVCYTKTRIEDLVVKELPGTICGIGNDSDEEKNDSLGHNVQLSPIPIFSCICSVTVDKNWYHVLFLQAF